MDPDRFKVNQQQGPSQNDSLSNLPPAPEHNYGTKAKPKKSKWWVWLILIILVLGGLSAWAISSYKSSKAKPTNHVAKVATKKAVASVAPIATPKPVAPSFPTASHTSTYYNTTFSYPSAWTVVDSGSAPLLVTSPAMNIVAANGQTVSGEVVLTLAKKGFVPSNFTTTSVAVMTSQKISYTGPSTKQAANSYISFVQYPSTTVRGGLDGIYLTGNYGYQKYQNIPSSNIASIDPFVDVTFVSCATTACPAASQKPLTIASSDWSDSSFSSPILYILQSFSFD